MIYTAEIALHIVQYAYLQKDTFAGSVIKTCLIVSHRRITLWSMWRNALSIAFLLSLGYDGTASWKTHIYVIYAIRKHAYMWKCMRTPLLLDGKAINIGTIISWLWYGAEGTGYWGFTSICLLVGCSPYRFYRSFWYHQILLCEGFNLNCAKQYFTGFQVVEFRIYLAERMLL